MSHNFQFLEPDLTLIDRGQTDEFVLADLYAAMFPNATTLALGQVRSLGAVLQGYLALREAGKMTDVQWIVYCASHLTGGISNGGIWDGLLGNQPQLVPDCIPLLQNLGLGDIAQAFEQLLAPILQVYAIQAEVARSGSYDLNVLWPLLETAEGELDEDAVEAFESLFFAEFKGHIETAAVARVFSEHAS